MWRLLLGTMGVKSLVQGLTAEVHPPVHDAVRSIITPHRRKPFRIDRESHEAKVRLLVGPPRCITSLPIELFGYETAAGHRHGRAVETWCPAPRTRAIITDLVYFFGQGREYNKGVLCTTQNIVLQKSWKKAQQSFLKLDLKLFSGFKHR